MVAQQIKSALRRIILAGRSGCSLPGDVFWFDPSGDQSDERGEHHVARPAGERTLRSQFGSLFVAFLFE